MDPPAIIKCTSPSASTSGLSKASRLVYMMYQPACDLPFELETERISIPVLLIEH